MLTSRAEYRLLLRQDNADLRLAPLAHQVGLISEERYAQVEARRQAIAEEMARLRRVSLQPEAVNDYFRQLGWEPLRQAMPAYDVLRRPGAAWELVERFAPPARPLPAGVGEQVLVEIRYEGYIHKQQVQVERAQRLEGWHIPDDLDYAALTGIRAEARERLMAHRPATVGQAARIQGVNPADISVLLVHLQRHEATER